MGTHKNAVIVVKYAIEILDGEYHNVETSELGVKRIVDDEVPDSWRIALDYVRKHGYIKKRHETE